MLIIRQTVSLYPNTQQDLKDTLPQCPLLSLEEEVERTGSLSKSSSPSCCRLGLGFGEGMSSDTLRNAGEG